MPGAMPAPSTTGSRHRLGVGATALAVVLWAMGSALAKKVPLAGQVLSLHRVAWAAALYLAIGAVRRQWLTTGRLRVAVWAGVSYGLTNVLFFMGVKETTIANATIIQALQPLPIMAVSNRLFGEPVTRRDVLLSVAALLGVALVVFGSSTTLHWSARGDLLCVGSLAAWVVYFVATKSVRARMGAVELQMSMLPTSTVVLLAMALASGSSLSPGGPLEWLGIVGIIATAGTGHLLLSWASPHLPITQASLLTLGQPVVGVALAAAFLGEPVVGWQLAGMSVVILTMAGVVLNRGGAAPGSAPAPAAEAGAAAPDATPAAEPHR
jgi:drug/metabolite transporter (DMT)-like permease